MRCLPAFLQRGSFIFERRGVLYWGAFNSIGASRLLNADSQPLHPSAPKLLAFGSLANVSQCVAVGGGGYFGGLRSRCTHTAHSAAAQLSHCHRSPSQPSAHPHHRWLLSLPPSPSFFPSFCSVACFLRMQPHSPLPQCGLCWPTCQLTVFRELFVHPFWPESFLKHSLTTLLIPPPPLAQTRESQNPLGPSHTLPHSDVGGPTRTFLFFSP